MSRPPAPFSNENPPPPLPAIPPALRGENRQSGLQTPMTDLRNTIETYRLSQNSGKVLDTHRVSPRDDRSPATSSCPQSDRNRLNSTQTEASQVSDVFEGGNRSRLASSATSNASDVNLKQPTKSLQPNKAKQVMGLDFTTKPLHGFKHGRMVSADGNITALENEYSDIMTPVKSTFSEPKSVVSIDEERVKETARDIFNGTELLVAFSDAAGWLMSSQEFNSRVRVAYMELYDFMGVNILNAVRSVHSRRCL